MSDPRGPSVTVVIPVRNRPEAIAACLRSLSALDYPSDRIDVVVVDDASTDDTPDVVRGAGPGVRLLARAEHSGQSACRNAGAADAAGDVIAFIDSDCSAHPGWLRNLVADFADPAVVAVGGGVLANAPRSWVERYEAVSSPLYKGSRPAEVVPGSGIDALASCNLLVRRTAFLDAGGFDAALSFGEDVDLVWRLRGRGGRILYRPDGAVDHDYRSRPGQFFVRRIHYATAKGMFLERYPRNRVVYDLPAGLLAASAVVVTATAMGRPELIPLAALPVAADAVASRRGAGFLAGLKQVVRAYGSAIYRILSHGGRQYALPVVLAGLVALPFWSRAWALLVAAGIALIVPAAVEWVRTRPALGSIPYAAAHVLDSMAINIGTAWGCVVHGTLRPLSVGLSLHATAASMPESRRPIIEPGTNAPAGSAP